MELAAIHLAMGEKGKALASYQLVFDAARAGDPKCAVCMEEAFIRMIPMFLEAQRYQDALETIDSYLKQFPHGTHVVDARTWRSQLPGAVTAGTEQPK